MNEMLFEIWLDEAGGQQDMGPVTEQSDKFRCATMPDAVRVHSFMAISDFQAFQTNYDWNDWGTWKPEPAWVEHFFTEAEVDEQRRYLAARTIR